MRLCEVATGKLVRIFNIPQPTIRTFAFSADGRMLAITNLDRSISLWEVATGQERASLGRARLTELPPVQTENVEASRTGDLPQNGELTCLTFSADGNRLAAGDSAGRVRLFDLKTGKEQTPLSGHIGPVVSLAFAANGRHLISGSTDMTALVWDVSMQPREENAAEPGPKRQALWATLRGNHAKKAYEAVRMLRDHPNLVVPFVQKQLRTITVDPKRLAQLIRDLDDDVFTTRENAQMELEKLGELSADAIRTALKGNPSLETLAAARTVAKTHWNRRQLPTGLFPCSGNTRNNRDTGDAACHSAPGHRFECITCDSRSAGNRRSHGSQNQVVTCHHTRFPQLGGAGS